jgi:hypothetical protein
VGPGGSREAAYDLKAGVPAGAYHVICDAIVIRPVDVTFELLWRRGAADTTVATWSQHFEPLPGGVFEAQPYELDQAGTAIDFKGGDQLVFRFTGANTTSEQAWIPNGDGATANGRIPNFTLPR